MPAALPCPAQPGWGSADGMAFDASAFLAAHPQFDWQTGYLKSRPVEPWVVTVSVGAAGEEFL